MIVTAANTAQTPGPEDEQGSELQDEFLGALTALGGSAGNGRLRETLEWDEATYEAVKTNLLGRRLILPGRGRGGSVVLSDGSGGLSGTRENSTAVIPRRGSNRARAAAPSSFDQAFRAIDDCLRKAAGCGTELDYTEQTSWLLFLKYLDGLEDDRAAMALLEGRSHTPILEEPYRWNSWAASKDANGPAGSQRRAHGRRPAGFCESTAVPLSGAVQAACQWAEHD